MGTRIKTTDGQELATNHHIIENAKASLLIVHGFGEHSLRYNHVAKAFNNKQINVYTFDLRGHGNSTGERAYVTNFKEYQNDLDAIVASLPTSLPLYILGHSMGGLITLGYLMKKKQDAIKGVLLSGAALQIGDDVNAFTQFIIKGIAKITPKLKTVKLDARSISRDKTEVDKYINDPLVYTEGTKAKFAVEFLNEINRLIPQFKDFNYPVLIMHGEKDSLVNKSGSESLYAQCQSKDKTLKIWGEAYHEIFNEINKEEIINYTTEWLNNRLCKP